MGGKRFRLWCNPERGTHAIYSLTSPHLPLPTHAHTKPNLLEAVCILEFPDRFVNLRDQGGSVLFPGRAQYLAKFMEFSKAHYQGYHKGCGRPRPEETCGWDKEAQL